MMRPVTTNTWTLFGDPADPGDIHLGRMIKADAVEALIDVDGLVVNVPVEHILTRSSARKAFQTILTEMRRTWADTEAVVAAADAKQAEIAAQADGVSDDGLRDRIQFMGMRARLVRQHMWRAALGMLSQQPIHVQSTDWC